MLSCSVEDLVFQGKKISKADGSGEITLMDIATKSMCGNTEATQVTVSHSSTVSPLHLWLVWLRLK